MSEDTFREARTLLNERDPDKVGRGTSLASIKDVTWVHQSYAMAHGYNSVVEMAIDELVAEVNKLNARLDRLEQVELYGMSLAARADHRESLDAGS